MGQNEAALPNYRPQKNYHREGAATTHRHANKPGKDKDILDWILDFVCHAAWLNLLS